MPSITSSLTSSPRSITTFAAVPISLPACTASRRMSPVEIRGIRCPIANRSAWVPFPAPGGPSITTLIDTRLLPTPAAQTSLLHEAIVVAHDQLALHLLHGVHGHADDDQE